ncbi:MAG: antibiotic biosynthesis monooxygenase [Anaerolineales bacterium]|nr:antibiotic biosynthesis monooxygenase [Anaerolineales bacterium]MBX3004794.1 antibiotic biosynthesis monooxygenase [Anaerolineales bacterium]
MSYGLHGKFTATPGNGPALLQILLQAAEGLRQNADCLIYLVSSQPGEPDAVWVSEVWTSQAAHQASLGDEATRTLIAEARPLIAAISDRVELAPQGGKGL